MGLGIETLKDLGEDITFLPEDFNLRERMNVYAGTAIGATAPVLFTRYVLFPSDGSTSSSIASWILTGMLMIGPYIPLAGATFGLCMGKLSAYELRDKRQRSSVSSPLENTAISA